MLTWAEATDFCRVLTEQEQQGRAAACGLGVSAADRSTMGVRLPRGNANGVFIRRRGIATVRVCLARRQFRKAAARGRPEAAESLGPTRHARQRVGVVPGLVTREACGGARSRGDRTGLGPGVPRRGLLQRWRELPLGVARLASPVEPGQRLRVPRGRGSNHSAQNRRSAYDWHRAPVTNGPATPWR